MTIYINTISRKGENISEELFEAYCKEHNYANSKIMEALRDDGYHISHYGEKFMDMYVSEAFVNANPRPPLED